MNNKKEKKEKNTKEDQHIKKIATGSHFCCKYMHR